MHLAPLVLAPLVLAAGTMLGASFVAAQDLRLTEDIVADPLTGAALLGFDPVAYFIDREARRGQQSVQTIFAGKVWLFASLANRSAFLAIPAPYLPAFGGHDPVGIAAGIAVAGSPEFFAVDDGRIYLFRHAQARDAFAGDRRLLALAEKNWPQVRLELVP